MYGASLMRPWCLAAGIRNELLRRVGNINFMQLLYALMIGSAHTHARTD